ncbi:hypothetical protein K438DRAFT_2000108 [Mycena galopus ATCC 62051]|nr:hypothetical protein K438DRAFT_2000108 [Mycena galopus ATCC 62051]
MNNACTHIARTVRALLRGRVISLRLRYTPCPHLRDGAQLLRLGLLLQREADPAVRVPSRLLDGCGGCCAPLATPPLQLTAMRCDELVPTSTIGQLKADAASRPASRRARGGASASPLRLRSAPVPRNIHARTTYHTNTDMPPPEKAELHDIPVIQVPCGFPETRAWAAMRMRVWVRRWGEYGGFSHVRMDNDALSSPHARCTAAKVEAMVRVDGAARAEVETKAEESRDAPGPHAQHGPEERKKKVLCMSATSACRTDWTPSTSTDEKTNTLLIWVYSEWTAHERYQETYDPITTSIAMAGWE